jgi:hypothetical protein
VAGTAYPREVVPRLTPIIRPRRPPLIARLSARRSSGYGRHRRAHTARRRVPRTRRRTLTAGDWLYVRWAALTCSKLPCAVDSRRAKACDRLVRDGAGQKGRRYDRHRRPVRRCLYRCVVRLVASLLPRGGPAGPRRRLAGHRDHHAHQPPLLRPGGLHSSTAGASSAASKGIIPGGHAGKTGRAVAIRYGEAVTAPALIALLQQVIASDRVGGWRELKRHIDGAGAGRRTQRYSGPVTGPMSAANRSRYSCVSAVRVMNARNPFATLSSASGARPGGGAMSRRGDQAPP